ncbi:MAG: Wzz/FepE/Etk N-terminal domain-containing protein [bacterium]
MNQDINQPISLSAKLMRRKGVIALTVLLALAVTFGVLLTRPLQYQARVQLLIIQNQTENQDLLSTLRATEQVGKSLVDVIYTSTFLDKVVATDFPIQKEFSDNAEERRIEWRDQVNASVSQQTGIITVSVFNSSKDQAAVLARGIAYVLTNESQEYHGKSNIIVTVVDDVYTKQWPVKPNLAGSTVAAIFFGGLSGIAIVALMPSKKSQSPKQSKPTLKIDNQQEQAKSGQNSIHQRMTLQELRQKSSPPDGLPIDEDI